MINKDDMSPAQREAVQKAYQILGEHFDCSLIVVSFEMVDDQNEQANAHVCYWHGGFMPALGLATYCHDRMLHGTPETKELEP